MQPRGENLGDGLAEDLSMEDSASPPVSPPDTNARARLVATVKSSHPMIGFHLTVSNPAAIRVFGTDRSATGTG